MNFYMILEDGWTGAMLTAVSKSVRLSMLLVFDARSAGEAMGRSVSEQIECWARLGRAIEPVLNGTQAMADSQLGKLESIVDLLATVDTPIGLQRLAEHLGNLPFPHYRPHPDQDGRLIRTNADGSTTIGCFQKRLFIPSADA